MKERVETFFNEIEKTLNNLKEGMKNVVTDIEIDRTIKNIKRFELFYEFSLRIIKEYLADMKIICKYPIDFFKYTLANSLRKYQDLWIDMIDKGYFFVHIYFHKFIRKNFKDIKINYLNLFLNLYNIKKG